MSPRAACRLETLGFTRVYDFVPGKIDWLAHGLAVAGTQATAITAGRLARDDVVTCGLGDSVLDVRERIAASPYGFGLVTSSGGVLLGRLRASALTDGMATRAEEAMDPGPSTVRPDTSAVTLLERLTQRGLRTAVVSSPDGVLLGVVLRSELESALSGDAASPGNGASSP